MTIEITKATKADLDQVAEFFWTAWRTAGPEAPGWTGADEETITELTTPSTLAERIAGPGRRMFLAWDGARVVGFAALRFDEDDAMELAGIIVLGNMLGCGIGKMLLDAAVRWATASGRDRMIVKTEAMNERALQFYQRHGFAVERRLTEEVGGTPVDLIELTRAL